MDTPEMYEPQLIDWEGSTPEIKIPIANDGDDFLNPNIQVYFGIPVNQPRAAINEYAFTIQVKQAGNPFPEGEEHFVSVLPPLNFTTAEVEDNVQVQVYVEVFNQDDEPILVKAAKKKGRVPTGSTKDE